MNPRELAARLRWCLDSLARYPRYAWRSLTRPGRVRLHGVWLVLDADTTPGMRRALYAESYERGEARCVLLRLATDDVVFEIGAGAGFISTLCALRVGGAHVTSYEANPALLRRIRATHAANGVAPELVHGVLAREAGSAEFYVEKEFVSSSLRRRSASALPVRVPQLAVNDEIRRIAPTFLVMDIEGGEAELLPVIEWRGIRKLILELHPRQIGENRARELVTLLASHGFREERAISTTRKKFFRR